MYPYIKPLQEIFKKYPFEKKIMVIPSYIDGNTFKKTLARQSLSALNFHHSTLFDLARRFSLDDLIKNKLNILDHSLGLVIIMQILKDLSVQKSLSYFQLPMVTPGLAKTIFRTIKEIRASGYTSQSWSSEITIDSGKMKDVHRIMVEYENQLQDRGLVDEAMLYFLAIHSQYREKHSIILVPSNLQMNPLEQLFFNKTVKPVACILEFPCPEATVAPFCFSLAEINDQVHCPERRILDFLNHKEDTNLQLPETDIEFFRTHGEYAETREVLRIILEKGIPFEKAQILYTVQEPYSQFFYQLLNSCHEFTDLSVKKIPVTFHSGIHIKNSHPARLFFDLIEWMNDNYSIKRLFTLLNSGNINLHLPEPFTTGEFASLLRQSPIGWGRERYLPGIQLAIWEREKRIESASDDKIQAYQTEIKYYQIIKDWIQNIFTLLPDGGFESRVSLGVLAGGIVQIINEFTIIKDNHLDLDEEALSIINQRMNMLEKNAKEEMTYSEALSIIIDVVGDEHICCSEPRAGKLHIASYKKGIWMDRPYTFIVGMDSHKFPGMAEEGTLFLETEKKPYRHLLSDTQKNRIEQFRLLHLILSLNGKKYLSYSCFDTLNNQEQAAASMLFHLYRLARKNPEKSHDEFYHDLGETRKLIPKNKAEFLDKGDIFLYFSKKEKRDLQPLFQQEYSHFIQGMKADLERKKEEFNAYNGKVKVATQKIDPRQNRGIVLSSSRLERIALCPYLYFLNDVLKVRLPEEMEYEPVQWLNPLERGLLLHQIYENFYQSLIKISKGQFDAPSYSRHWPTLERITNESLEEKRRYLAPPGELIFQAEKREILESCQIFLIGEEKYYQGQVPQYFELAFGTRDNEHEVLGKVKSVELILPAENKISFQGKIDRIDRLPDGTFRIIDYKTGSSREYKKGKPFRFGQQIQHALYAIALEKILEKKITDKNPTVSLSGYYFPTAQGQGSLILYKRENRDLVLQIVEILLDIIAQGSFAMTQKPEHFMCRDYKDIMEQNEVISVSGKKGERFENEPALDGLRRLKQFE